MDAVQIYQNVQDHYGSASKSDNVEYGRTVAKSFGYSEEELASIPEEANLGLSCGNPLAIASLREGETVIDLGSGAGFDVFLAAKNVGPSGRAIGVDMNPDMLARANTNKENSGVKNIHFVQSQITNIALGSGIADCLISNCVINLVPEEEKQLVFNEMFRLLKPGGRVALSDILARQPLPDNIQNDIALYVGCIAGASQVHEYEKYLADAGFKDTLIADTHSDLNVYLDTDEDGKRRTESKEQWGQNGCCGPRTVPCCGGPPKTGGEDLNTLPNMDSIDLNEWAGSYKIFAVKP
ncbi:ubiE/COQ5 methyltransferase [Rhizodiscina lignyota]|uniref:Arsenite methyltransferase n=1 Tax=Rhizodiscina lignyota TaxID=1504668 RepID=A0A9P4M801_9PEZI|nr:ubiE/COQ5 methyltransferase [Rhizodiscina lignyota]